MSNPKSQIQNPKSAVAEITTGFATPVISRRTVLTLSTAATLYGVYGLYAMFVGPLLEPATIEGPTTIQPGNNLPVLAPLNRKEAERHLADHPWTADAKYQVHTPDGAYVYAEEWERVEPGGEVRFKPFAMIWKRPDDDPDKEPLVIVSDSALLKFQSRFEISNPRPGRVIGGALEDQVTIRGADGLLITGRDFYFSEHSLKVWSDGNVAFASGGNKGTGHGMELDLIPEPNSKSQDKPAVSGVRVVRLRKNVVMDLVPEADEPNKQPDTVRVTSAGRFEYDVEHRIAAFHNDVRVARPTAENQFDTLHCDTLTLLFEAAAKNALEPARAAPDLAAGKLGDNMTFRRLRAEGKPVVLVSQGNDLRAEMAELTYDAQSRIVTLHDGREVKVVQKNNELFSPEMTIEHDANNKPVQFVCRGAGRLYSYEAADPQAESGATLPGSKVGTRRTLSFSAEWLKQLRQFPDPTAGLDVIEFQEQAILSQPGQMVLEADLVKIWVTKQESSGELGRVSPIAAPDNRSDTSRLPPVKPKRLLAVKQVVFAGPQIEGETDRLEVVFEEGKLPLTRPVPQRDPQAGLRPRSTSGSSSYSREPTASARSYGAVSPTQTPGFTKKPGVLPTGYASVNEPPLVSRPVESRGAVSSNPKPGLPQSAKESQKPLHVEADQMRVRSIEDGGKREVAEIWNEGHVHVTQDRKPGTAPLDVRGDKLHLQNYAEERHILRVEGTVGRPAQVRDGDMQLTGPDINLDRGENLAHVVGPGSLKLPLNNGMDGKPLDKPQTLDVSWKEQMRFDGAVAKFFASVVAIHASGRMRCEEMHVTLSNRVSFSQRDPSAQKAEVSHVLCREFVELENKEFQAGRLVSSQLAKVQLATLSQITGETTARGPGTLIAWQRGDGKRGGIAPRTGIQANRALQTETLDWEYTQVNFAGTMHGNTRDHNTTFKERVLVIHGPVNRETEVIDINNLRVDAGWMKCDELHIIQHPESRGMPAWFDLLGERNVQLEGKTTHGDFNAQADKVSFDQSKGLYILQSLGNRKATIWRQTKTGGQPSSIPGMRIEFIPSLNQLRVDRASGLDVLE